MASQRRTRLMPRSASDRAHDSGAASDRTDTGPCAVLACARFRSQPTQRRERAMTVKVALELTELRLQIRGRPEQRAVETFAAYRAD